MQIIHLSDIDEYEDKSNNGNNDDDHEDTNVSFNDYADENFGELSEARMSSFIRALTPVYLMSCVVMHFVLINYPF